MPRYDSGGTAPARRTGASRSRTRRVWKLEEAKARFSELVRCARSEGPQRVTVRGEPAVVVMSADDYARLVPVAEQPSLHRMLSESPLRELDFEFASERSPVRKVAL